MSVCLLRGLAAVPAQAQPAPAASPAAQAPTAPPATAPAEHATLDVVVLEVKGTVQASTDDGKTWARANAGLHLTQGASFRTGFHSSVTCGIAPDQGFTLESLGTVRVEEAIKNGKHFKTDLVMKYGATNYSIETGGAEHESTIRTPGSTLAVRGTVVRVTDRPGFAPTAESFTGRAVFKTAKGTTTVGTKGGRYSRVSAADADAVQTALSQTVVDPAAILARTATDAQLIAQQASLGAVVSFDVRANIPVVRDSTPLSDADLLKSLPGTLDFVLRWTGNADLNLIVDDDPLTAQDIAQGQALEPKLRPVVSGLSGANLGQLGILLPTNKFQPRELLYPGYGSNVSQSGGVIPYDNRGGPKGGMEIAYWTGTPPLGIFGLGVIHVSGAPANYQINAFLDGNPLEIFYGSSGKATTSTLLGSTTPSGSISSGPNDHFAALALAPNNAYLANLLTAKQAGTSSSTQTATARAANSVKGAAGVQPIAPSVGPQATAVRSR